MESHEVMRRAFRKVTPKAVAAELGVSLSLVYKWAEKPTVTGSGSRNPLDRLLEIIELSEDNEILEWLCAKQGGCFVQDGEDCQAKIDHVVNATQELIGSFSDLLRTISDSTDDYSVSEKEADAIRILWDKLKSHGESFVRQCETGKFKTLPRISV